MDHISIIIIVSGYIRSRKRSAANIDKSELVPIFMWDKPIWSSLNDSSPKLSVLIATQYVMTHIMMTEESSDVSSYYYIIVVMSA